MSRLSQQSKKVNWARLRIKGASIALQTIADDQLNLTFDELVSLNKAINKIEMLMINKLVEDYKVFKATELQCREAKIGLSKAARK